MLDATALEKKGIHTVTIAWDTFEEAARSQAQLQGVPDLDLVVVPHRKGGEDTRDQEQKAEGALPEILAKLVEPI